MKEARMTVWHSVAVRCRRLCSGQLDSPTVLSLRLPSCPRTACCQHTPITARLCGRVMPRLMSSDIFLNTDGMITNCFVSDSSVISGWQLQRCLSGKHWEKNKSVGFDHETQWEAVAGRSRTIKSNVKQNKMI